jgi:imidazolonepropionase-like amidohydrolase/Tol biopolymer transport system component
MRRRRRLHAPLAAALLGASMAWSFDPALAHDGDVAHAGSRAANLVTAEAASEPATPPANGTSTEARAEAAATWDVDHPPGPTTEARIDTTEGTWMSVDVSPDGSQLVFDFLGDLYLLPLTGGEAKAVTTGMAWDEQPRFSPDGKSIAFTSDRGGGDNIWILRLDLPAPTPTLAPPADPAATGSPADAAKPAADLRFTQVTKESFRLLNSPAWSPDGQYLVARKHFTSQRSAGAGEIWIYHRSGGDGLQLVKKRNDQKDIGEPAFSADGRYVYYSQDATPGDTFDYNKDPNGQIYVVDRLDRETGEVERWLGGAGGAIRPTPSPDGKSLAYIRRIRAKSVLMLHDQASGADTPLYDGLDRDLQETWAIHGVYPQIAWTPDSKALVFWSAGKLHRLEVASRQAREIPFHVTATRTVSEALRFPVDVAPSRFPLKMLRWVSVAPAGDRVVYQALGRLWVKDLPNGAPRRLTSQESAVELFPSFSRDGRQVVYTTWNDDNLGTVSVVNVGATPGQGRVLTGQPGHYVEPVLSPDGKTVVYRSIGGNSQRGRLWSHELGVYALPVQRAAGTTATPFLLTRDGATPHFGAASDRVYLLRFVGEDHRQLVSLDLAGGHERVHADSEAATEFRVSPDGRWLAFRERFNAFITPFVPTGQKVGIGPKASAMPVAQVSKDAGAYLQWSGDSHRLYWSLGPELYHRDLAEAFAFLAAPSSPTATPDKPAEPAPLVGTNLGFEAAADLPSGAVAFVGGQVVTMRGDEVLADGVVVVRDNRIVAVGQRGEVAVPADAKVVDTAGKTLLPGLIDVHWHGDMGSDEIIPQRNWGNYASLAFGVTTLHDPSNDSATIFAASELARAGGLVAPRIFSTGTILYGAAGDFRAQIDSLDDARSTLRRMQALGAWSVKSYNQPRREQRQQVIAAARELGMMVVPEGGSLFPANMSMIVDGHTGIEHSLPLAKVYEDVLSLWSQSHTWHTPTLVVSYGGLMGENYWYGVTDVWKDERLSTFVPREILDARSRRRQIIPAEELNHIAVARTEKELLDRGVHVQLGAHGQREGLAAHWELWMMVQGGMTPQEALRAGTLAGAQYLGLDRDLGSLEPGKLADLIVLDGDPLADIRNSESVHYVMVNGRLYDAATMDEVGNRPQPRGKFWWEMTP